MVVALRLTLLRDATAQYPLSLFIIPVIFSAWYGGAIPAAIAAALAVVAGTVFFSPYNLKLDTTSGLVRVFLFAFVNTVCVFVITRLHRERYKAEQEILKREKIEAQLALALQKAEFANKAKTDFLSNMSHEIRTPLNAVVGLARILGMSSPLTDKQKEFVSTLQLSADALLMLITDVLDVSKIEAGAVEIESIPFNLRQICEDVVGIMSQKASEKNLHLILEADGLAHADYIGDPQRIKQVVMNLCGNAIKFTHAGVISVALHADEIDAGNDLVSISVKDTGIGIPPDQLPKIFDQFAQGDADIHKKYGGTGLGLTISKKLMEAMGGTITVESKYAVGSVFKLRLPLKKTPATVVSSKRAEAASRLEASRPQSKEAILIVEDNEANILVARSYMERLGYSYEIALTGADALKKIEERRYLAVLMDIRMPGLDGLETTRIIRRNEARLKRARLYIVGVTANALDYDRQQCFDAGMDDYMTKPFDPAILQKKLQNLSWPDVVTASSGI